MEFSVLGPLAVYTADGVLDLGGVRNKTVLAALLLATEKVAGVNQLVEVLWDDSPPSTARHQVHKCVAQLRERLQRAGASATIVTENAAYRMALGTDQLDLRTFLDEVRDAERAAAAGGAAQAVHGLRAALSTWRGPALAGLDNQALRKRAEQLEQQRISVVERCLSLELELGRHREVLPELRALVSALPLSEDLTGLLVLALHRSDRQAEAAEVYRRLVDDRGVEPGLWLREVHRTVFGGNANRPLPWLVPAQLPPHLTRFSGRDEQIEELDEVAAAGGNAAVIVGTAGIGKTALAVRWAHRTAEWFPDGQLYLNLRGYDAAPPTTPAAALPQFLRALGVDGELIPRELDEQTAMYRSLMSRKRMLVLLDNAATEEQVRPLLPACAGCFVVITSRNELRGLTVMEDAHRIMLDVLPPEQAHTLIAHIIGWERAAAEPDAVAELATLCGHLPLAMRIAAANLACRPKQAIAAAAAELAEGDRLAKLAVTRDRKAGVAGAFDLSYQALPAQERILFRRLGILPRPDFTVHTAAALVERTPESTQELVAVLEDMSLVEPTGDGWYHLHDLLHLFAREKAQEEEEDQHVRRRLLDFYLFTTDAAVDLVAPELTRMARPSAAQQVVPLTLPTRNEALRWLELARENLVIVIGQCAAGDLPEYAWHLADALRPFFWLSGRYDDWSTTARAGLHTATLRDDLGGQAAMHAMLGHACIEADTEQALTHYDKALSLYRTTGSHHDEYRCLIMLGGAHLNLGRSSTALGLFEQALAATDTPNRAGAALTNLSAAAQQLGLLTTARTHSERGLASYRQLGGGVGEARCLAELGQLCVDLGRLDEARGYITRASEVARESKNRLWEHHATLAFARLECDTGQVAEAERHASSVLGSVHERAEAYYALMAGRILGVAHHHFGRLDAAVDALARALRTAQKMSRPFDVTALTIDLARSLAVSGQRRTALHHAEEALKVSEDNEYRVLRGRALTLLAALHLGHQDERSIRLARKAHDLQQFTGYLLGQAEALLVLGRSTERAHGREAAEPFLHRAGKIVTRFTDGKGRYPAGIIGEADLR